MWSNCCGLEFADWSTKLYSRTIETGDPYVGQSKSMGRFAERQAEHDRANPNADDPYNYEILGRANPGDDLDALEEYYIQEGGGPTNKGNPEGCLSNRRHQMNEQRYSNYLKNNPGVFSFQGFTQCALGE